MSRKVVSLLSILLFVCILVGCSSVNAEPIVEDTNISQSSNMPVMDDGGFYEVIDASGAYETGSALQTNRLRVAYLDCDPDWTGYGEYYKPADGYRVVRAYFRFTNLSDTESGCGRFDFSCTADGVSCKEYYAGSVDDLPHFTSIGVDETVEGWLYFTVPDDASRVELSYFGDDLRYQDDGAFVFVIG